MFNDTSDSKYISLYIKDRFQDEAFLNDYIALV